MTANLTFFPLLAKLISQYVCPVLKSNANAMDFLVFWANEKATKYISCSFRSPLEVYPTVTISVTDNPGNVKKGLLQFSKFHILSFQFNFLWV